MVPQSGVGTQRCDAGYIPANSWPKRLLAVIQSPFWAAAKKFRTCGGITSFCSFAMVSAKPRFSDTNRTKVEVSSGASFGSFCPEVEFAPAASDAQKPGHQIAVMNAV